MKVINQLFQALRLHQWVKNLLLVVPLITAHRFGWQDWTKIGFAFITFGLVASAVYLFNDIWDRHHDRVHPQKKFRPFASGFLSPAVGYGLMTLCLGVALLISWWRLPLLFTKGLIVYAVMASLYTVYLKRVVILDVIIVAGFYTLRVILGGVATGLALSPWLLAFSLFFFLSLAVLKRYSELLIMRDQPNESTAQGVAPGRGYMFRDVELLGIVGPISGLISVLVYALYINSPQVGPLYGTPLYLWSVAPLLIYFVTRLWLLARRDQLHDDPLSFIFSDRVSLLIGTCVLLLMGLATYA